MSRKRTDCLNGFFRRMILLVIAFPALLFADDRPVPETLHVAVASNFTFPLKQIAKRFQKETGIAVITSSGSTGTLYAQISNGAPFDVFLSADSKRPMLLVENGFAVKSSLTTYAYGQIILWGNDHQLVPENNSDECLTKLKQAGRLAIANPLTAPYGTAAKESLQKMGLWKKIKPRIVYGNNIVHTFQFVDTGNVDFGIVALSEYLRLGKQRAGCIWKIPDEYHSPLEQQAVILKRAEKNANTVKFMAFLTDRMTRKSLEYLGYGNH